MSHYIQLFKDSSFNDLWRSVPTIPITYRIAPTVKTTTINGKVYKFYDNGTFDGVPQIKARPLLSWADNNIPLMALYLKNGLSINSVLKENTGARFENYRYPDTPTFVMSGNNHMINDNNQPSMWGIEFVVDGVVFLGFTKFLNTKNGWPGYIIASCCFELSFWTDALRPSYDYGNKPDGEGGQGNGSIDGTGVHTSPTPSGHVPTGGRGLHIYRISQQGYNSVQDYLWGEGSTLAKTLWQKFMNHNHNPANCICGCFQLPQIFMPPRGAASGVQLGGVNLPTTGTFTTPHLYIDTNVYSLGTISPPFGSWLDYAGVSCKIAVPFCGEIPVPVEKVWNKEVTVQYRCDTFNGNFGAIIKAGGDMIANVTGNAAYQIPIVAGDDGTLERIGAAAAGVLGIVTAGSSAAAMSAAGTAAAGIAGAQYNTFCTNGNTSGNAQSVINGVAYIEYIVPQTAKINSGTYSGTYGMPSCVSGTLSEFRGGYGEFDVSLQEVANVWNATPEEKDEIVKLLEGGVFV